MKRKILLLFFGICFLVSSKAQFKFGLSGGINFANVRSTYNSTGNSLTKFGNYLIRLNGGVDLGYYFDSKWGLQSGVYYAGKGWRDRLPSTHIDTVITRLNYIEVPLKVNYRMQKENGNCIVASSGFYFAYGFSGKVTTRGSSRIDDPFKDYRYKRFDFGYVIESLYEIKNSYAAKLSFSHSLKSMRSRPDILKNFLFNFSLLFIITKK